MIGAGESTLASDSPSAGGRWLMKGGLDSPSGGVRAEAQLHTRRFPGFLQVLQRELNHEREVKEGAGLFKGKALEGWRNEVTQCQCRYQCST